MATVQVRNSTAGDGLAIAWIQLEVWQAAFADVLPDDVLTAAPAELAQSWTAAFKTDNSSVEMATEGDQVVGFVHAGLIDPDPDQSVMRASVGQIHVLYVRPAWARRGHGGRLIASAAARLRVLGAHRGIWWVPETDRATTKFLESIGWESDGASRVLDTGKAHLRELRWTGSLELMLGSALL